MSAPDPGGTGLLAALVGAAVAIVTPFMWARSWVEKRLATKADRKTVEEGFERVEKELAHQRGTQAKLFDQIRESDQRAQDRHERLLERLPKP